MYIHSTINRLTNTVEEEGEVWVVESGTFGGVVLKGKYEM